MGPRVFTRGNSPGFSLPLGVRGRLQWGHASSRVETARIATKTEPVMGLQWGHASSRVETNWQYFFHLAPLLASMGPRVFTRGNFPALNMKTFSTSGFNGATRLHAWKLSELGFEHEIRRIASMGPRVFTRGNVSVSGDEVASDHSFNGATRLHAWKLSRTLHDSQPFGGFNGATRLHAWKRIQRRP